MTAYIFLTIDAFEAASNVNNFWAMVCFLIAGVSVIFGGLSGKKGDNTKLYVASGLALAMCIIGALVHVNTSDKVEEEYKKLEEKYNTLLKERDTLIEQRGVSTELQKCCHDGKIELEEAMDTIKKLSVNLDYFKREKDRKFEENSDLKANDARPYNYVQRIAVVKNKEGMWGYLRQGDFISKVDFIYTFACRFYDGMAGVKKKGTKFGFINSDLELVTGYKYDNIWGFNDGKAKVELDGETFYIDKRGNRINE